MAPYTQEHDGTLKESVSEGVSEAPLDSWKAFADFIRDEHALFPAGVYRGQADAAWVVESSLDRLIRRSPNRVIYMSDGTTQKTPLPPASQRQHLEAFKDAARGRLWRGERPRDDAEWWALGQQHGLCTPLLDFTASPFVALFFAFEEQFCHDNGRRYEPKERAVFGIPFHIDQLAEQEHRGKRSEVRAIRPVGEGGYRLTSQAGLFVQLPLGSDLGSWVRKTFAERSRRSSAILTKILIPNIDRVGCLRFLSKMNISRLSLFPDLDGSAAHINRLWEMNFDTDLGFHASLEQSSNLRRGKGDQATPTATVE